MTVSTEELNKRLRDDPAGFIKSADDTYYNQILGIAKDIYDHRNERPIILLSGPSGSGKTTTALEIEKLLDGWGCETHTLSMDNYFKPLSGEEKGLAALGKLDLESPNRVDIPYLNGHLEKLIACEEVDIPKYDFKESCRVSSGCSLKRKPGELVIFEGIHALNPDVITIPDENSARIYVSVRTRVKTDDLILHPENIRLLRRMIRDKKYRNRSIKETLNMFDSVQLGEKKYIMPYKYRAEYSVDTFIAYEAGVYKTHLMDELRMLQEDERVLELIQIMENIDDIQDALVPKTSLIREFIGNGQFHY